MARTRKTDGTIYLHDDDTPVCWEALVTPGTPDRGPDFACAGGYPGSDPEVEIISLTDEQGRELTFEISQGDTDAIIEAALEQANEDLVCSYDDEREHVNAA